MYSLKWRQTKCTQRKSLEANRSSADAVLAELGQIGERMQEVSEALAGVQKVDANAGDDLRQAYQELKHALMQSCGCTPDQMHRIT